MSTPPHTFKRFFRNLGLVEQAQVVASTAVVVTMITIISALILTGHPPRWIDFVSIIAVGLIGFFSVLFSLKYTRLMDEQRNELLAINSIAEAVNRHVELDEVLSTALEKVTELLNTPHGWVYKLQGNRLILQSAKGTTTDFLRLKSNVGIPHSSWLHQPRILRERLSEGLDQIDPELKTLGIQFCASIPLRSKDTVAGALIVAGDKYEMFSTKEAELMEALGQQISIALDNATLFDLIRQSEQRYADLFEHSPDTYISVDCDQRILDCNATGSHLLGYAKDELLGRAFTDLFTENDRPLIAASLKEMFENGQEFRDSEHQVVTKQNRTYYVSLGSSLLVDHGGRPVSARIVARDISERKRMQSTMLHIQKIESIGNLAGGIAHDFNNILAAIQGSAAIIRRRLPENMGMTKFVEIVEGAAHRGSSLTRQLLTFARRTETTIKPVDIHQVIDETLILFQRSARKDIEVIRDLCSEVATTNGDEGQIQQALLNLFLNARDAMPEGGTLTIKTRIITADAHTTSQYSAVKPGPFVAISVTDTGIGMDKATQMRVFEPWFTTKEFGTGLGLSVLYGVVQNHGGFITLESQPGHGSMLCMHLPSIAMKLRAAGRQRQQKLPRGTEHILLIDDEVSVCDIATDMLTNLGYTVNVAHNGKAGIEIYKSRQASIDLILMNINMPQMGGRETFCQLRAITPELRIIFVTGHDRDAIEEKGLPGEINAFIQKPFDVEELAHKIRLVLDGHHIETESTT